MAIALNKGESFELNSGEMKPITKIRMGVGWDPVPSGNFFWRLFFSESIDLDASCVLFDKNKEIFDLVYYGHLRTNDESVEHSGDNLTGDGEGDDEYIDVDLSKLSENVHYLAFTINSFRGQTFDEVANAVCRLIDLSNNEELCRYVLSERGCYTAVIMVVLKRQEEKNSWQITALGEMAHGKTARDIVEDVFDVL
ncbi:MAG: hypothetical protein CMK59_11130 [Proteobacteria bacterium]|nr:hypothetical protein [Pseudomonadota bacterium]